ncbi:MAG: Xaa-Pro peptidase family protein [Candidatus Promineifilaceae bacterium]|nr:Xaa-Pro peptidase family protein [Candidatus Promineifilaceae bacterium]
MNQDTSSRSLPPRGFAAGEFERRLYRAQRLISDEGIGALLLTTEPDVRYFSGFLTQFWQSPTRPWFLVVPWQGKPIAVIPEIGAAAMAGTWIDDVRTWPAPSPLDDGVSLLAQTLTEVAGATGRVALPLGPETHLRMPLTDFGALRRRCPGAEFVDATSIVRALRLIKSEAEIEKIAHICDLVSEAFVALPDLIAVGDTERDVFRAFKIDVLRRGADDVPYLVGGAGQGGYEEIISPPSGRRLQTGDLLMLDTGSVFDGYFCDFDRNYAAGRPSDAVRRTYDRLYSATEAGLRAARPGATCADLFAALRQALGEDDSSGSSTGRLGHGLGMQLTEWPSLMPADRTVLRPGMVITLEPAITMASGRMMVHEEDVVIREDGAQLLTRRAPPDLPVIE